MMGGDYLIYDREISEYEDLLVSGGQNGDVAIVTISRMGGENSDLPMDMGDPDLLGSDSYTNRTSSFGDPGKSYLELQDPFSSPSKSRIFSIAFVSFCSFNALFSSSSIV